MVNRLDFASQWKLLAAHLCITSSVFHLLKWWYSKPLVVHGEKNDEPQLKRGIRTSFLLSSVFTRVVNLLLVSCFDFESFDWIPSVFQQIMLSNYLHEIYVIVRFKNSFSHNYLRFIAMHHIMALVIFLMWYCMGSSRFITIVNPRGVGIMATLWEVCTTPGLALDAWIAMTISNDDTPTQKRFAQRDPFDIMIFKVVCRSHPGL
jgi:hypothetical protein